MSFEFKYFVCRHVSIWDFWNRVCSFVYPYPEKRNHPGFVNISSTLVNDTSMKRSLGVLQHENPKVFYASLSSGEAYRDRQLTTNFKFWVEIFCVPTCFHMTIPKPCLSVSPSVCPSVRLSVHLSVPREKKSP